MNFQKSSVYIYYQKELKEILKHKWIESEKVGHDIGFEKALLDWIYKYRDDWRKAQKKAPPKNR